MLSVGKHRESLPGVIIAGGFLLVSLFLIGDYGVSWDEPLHAQWANQIIEHLVAGKAGLPDLVGKGIYYGPAYYLLNHIVMNLAAHAGMGVIPSIHVLNVIFASLGIFCVFGLARALFSERIAICATLLCALYPPLLAHAQYNPKDMPTMVMVTACLWAYIIYVRRPSMRQALIAGLLTGIAMAMKITGLLAIPIFLIAYALHLIIAERPVLGARLATDLKRLPIALGGIVVALAVSWPTLWRDPFLLFKSIQVFLKGDFWDGTVRYFGVVYPGTQLPWHYTPMWLFFSTPLVVVALCLMGIVVALRSGLLRRTNVLGYMLILSWLALPVLLSMKPGLARYDGLRQILLVVPAVAILAGIGVDTIITSITRRFPRAHQASVVLMVAICGWLIVESVRVHPYQGSYVNEAVRAMYPSHLEDQFEIEYWGTTYKEGVEWLRFNAKENATICVPFVGQLMLFYTDEFRSDFNFNCDADRTYVMYFTRNSSINSQYKDAGRVVFSIQRYDSDLLRIIEL